MRSQWMMGLAGMAMLAAATPAAAENGSSDTVTVDRGWDDASNAGEALLVAAALAIPAAKHDWHGDLAALASTGVAFGVTQGLKQAFPEVRPDRSGDDSFPSGHSAVSFAAAASLQNRYGWKIGLPAQVAAGFVGLARVEAHRHFWYDVVAGAAIGEASGFLLTSKRNSNVHVLPWGDAHGGGAIVAMQF